MNAMRFNAALLAACLSLAAAEQASAFYAPHMGRFTSRDPNGETGRIGLEMPPDAAAAAATFVERDPYDPMTQYGDGMNLYQYVQASPMLLTDPSGLLVGEEVIIVEEVVGPIVTNPPAAAGVCAFTGGVAVGYCVGKCTTGPLTEWALDWYYQPCPPCPEPPKPRVDRTHDHGDCFKKTGSNTHWHYFVYDQNPDTCTCYLRIIFGGCGELPF